MQENFLDAIFGILFIFCHSKQATRPNPLLDWEMANSSIFVLTFWIEVLTPDIYGGLIQIHTRPQWKSE
jgi:hypothetical protein